MYLNCKWFPAIIVICFFFLVSFHVIGTYCPKWYFIVGRIVPLVFLYCKMNKLFFIYFQMAKKLRPSEATKFLFRSSSDDDASSESSYSPDSEDCSETSANESEDTLSEVQQPGSSDDDAAGAQPSTSRDPLRMIRNKMLHVILLFGTNLQLLSHPTFPLMTTSHANLQLQCLQHYRKLIPSKFSFQKVCVYLLPSVQMKELTCITSKKCYDSSYRRRRRDDSFRGYVCNVLQPTT